MYCYVAGVLPDPSTISQQELEGETDLMNYPQVISKSLNSSILHTMTE